MKEDTWEECLETASSLKVSPDQPKAKSLMETAQGRINFLDQISIKENNASYIFEGYYSSLLEMIHALVI